MTGCSNIIIDINKPLNCYELDLIIRQKSFLESINNKKIAIRMNECRPTHISSFEDSSSCSMSDATKSEVRPVERLHTFIAGDCQNDN